MWSPLQTRRHHSILSDGRGDKTCVPSLVTLYPEHGSVTFLGHGHNNGHLTQVRVVIVFIWVSLRFYFMNQDDRIS